MLTDQECFGDRWRQCRALQDSSDVASAEARSLFQLTNRFDFARSNSLIPVASTRNRLHQGRHAFSFQRWAVHGVDYADFLSPVQNLDVTSQIQDAVLVRTRREKCHVVL